MQAKLSSSLRGWIAIGVAVSGLSWMPQARASLINVDFNTDSSVTYSGAAIVGSAGDKWNGIDGGNLGTPANSSNVALLDAAGAATGVTLSMAGTSGAYDSAGFGCLIGSSPFAALMCDYVYRSAAAAATVTLVGLTPGAAFDLILYASADVAGRITDFALDGVTKSVTAAPAASFVSGTNYVQFSGAVGANGVLSFTFAGPAEGNLDGLQLTQTPNGAVPEPATLALVGLGLAAAGWRRKSC